MSDNAQLTGAADRSRVAAGEPYEVAYFAQKHGLTQDRARALIERVGNDRAKLDAAAEAEKRSAPAKTNAVPRRRKAPAKRAAAKPDVSKPAAAAAPRPAASKAAATKASAPKRTRAAAKPKAPAPSKTPVAAATVAPAIATMVEPVKAGAAKASAATRDAARSVGESAKALGADFGRRTARTRRRIAEAPATVGRKAGKMADATKKAATSRTAAMVGAAAAGLVTGLVVNLGRKVAVQAPSVMAGDWFEALKGEHQAALKLFDQIEATSVEEPAKRSFLLTQLQHALAKHAFTEENVVYPALREWGDKVDADKLNHDHGYVKQHLYELDAIDPRSSQFLVKLAAFRADLEAHVREEEESIFPPLHAALGENKNKTVTALANKEGFKLA